MDFFSGCLVLASMPSEGMCAIVVFGGIILLIAFSALISFVPIHIWLSAKFAGVPVSIGDLFGMKMRNVSPKMIVDNLVKAHKAGLGLSANQLETHFLASGNIGKVVDALISANRANIDLTFEQACAIDLAGRDVFQAVQMSVNPKIIDVTNLIGTAMDGVQLNVKVRVTVRANIGRLVGGATEETVKARVGQGIVAEIGSSKSYKDVLENPDKISARVLGMGLDSGTAFEILSIDVADVDVGKNIGAELQANQAEADMRTAEAKARERRSMAEAREQEMKALAEEMRAKVIEAEAEVPKALASALKTGKMGVMDYYNLENVKADTSMRKSIGGTPQKPTQA